LECWNGWECGSVWKKLTARSCGATLRHAQGHRASATPPRLEIEKVAKVLIPIPSRDFDPSEVAVSWSVLKQLGHSVTFATPDGQPGHADDMMLTGQGLDFWGFLPGLKNLTAVGRLMRADADARQAYAAMVQDPAFKAPLAWQQARREDFDGLLLPGGHRARGMREYLESDILQKLIVQFFAAGAPIAAICHGVLLAARSRTANGNRSVLFGRHTTALTWALERKGWMVGRIVRFWDPNYYRTYDDRPGQPTGYMSVQQEATRALVRPSRGLPRRSYRRSRLQPQGKRHGPRYLRRRSRRLRRARRQLRVGTLARRCAYFCEGFRRRVVRARRLRSFVNPILYGLGLRRLPRINAPGARKPH
jgi:putative intracellular protease/amidase